MGERRDRYIREAKLLGPPRRIARREVSQGGWKGSKVCTLIGSQAFLCVCTPSRESHRTGRTGVDQDAARLSSLRSSRTTNNTCLIPSSTYSDALKAS